MTSSTPEAVRLGEMDWSEWRDVIREVAPQVTDEEFDLAWTEFQDMKRRKAMQ
jgi:hypothetical protein